MCGISVRLNGNKIMFFLYLSQDESEDVEIEAVPEKVEEPKETEEKKEGEEAGDVKKDTEGTEGETPKTDGLEKAQTEGELKKPEPEKPKEDPNIEYDEVEEFYVKYKN